MLYPQAGNSGSSPLARGLRQGCAARPRSEGIIPARAGFTRRPPRKSPWSPDHPRSRGVYGAYLSQSSSMAGSSPLARGLRAGASREDRVSGIIPARAGFTGKPYGAVVCEGDHPRSRGVYANAALAYTTSVGSSPLARGLLSGAVRVVRHERIIPARAGFTPMPGGQSARRGDHPRSRGVYSQECCPVWLREGSSPLARGLLMPPAAVRQASRIIPARAGFTLAEPWNPNDEAPYQTAFAFTADLALAPQGSDSVVVLQQSTRTPSEP